MLKRVFKLKMLNAQKTIQKLLELWRKTASTMTRFVTRFLGIPVEKSVTGQIFDFHLFYRKS